jgi:hypothetical protein
MADDSAAKMVAEKAVWTADDLVALMAVVMDVRMAAMKVFYSVATKVAWWVLMRVDLSVAMKVR